MKWAGYFQFSFEIHRKHLDPWTPGWAENFQFSFEIHQRVDNYHKNGGYHPFNSLLRFISFYLDLTFQLDLHFFQFSFEIHLLNSATPRVNQSKALSILFWDSSFIYWWNESESDMVRGLSILFWDSSTISGQKVTGQRILSILFWDSSANKNIGFHSSRARPFQFSFEIHRKDIQKKRYTRASAKAFNSLLRFISLRYGLPQQSLELSILFWDSS